MSEREPIWEDQEGGDRMQLVQVTAGYYLLEIDGYYSIELAIQLRESTLRSLRDALNAHDFDAQAKD